MIINVGLTRVTFAGNHPQPTAREPLRAAGIELFLIDHETMALGPVEQVERRYLSRHAHRNIPAGDLNSSGNCSEQKT